MSETKLVIDENLFKQYDTLKKKRDDLDAEIKRLGDAIKTTVPPGKYEAGVWDVEIRQSRGSLKTDLFERDFPYDQNKDLYAPKPSIEAILREVEEPLDYFGTTTSLYLKKSRRKPRKSED